MSEWIKVEDRPPDNGQYVAVWLAPFANPKGAFWMNSTFYNGQFESKKSMEIYKNVTHWMKIEPPKD